jgi:hypothetical protein
MASKFCLSVSAKALPIRSVSKPLLAAFMAVVLSGRTASATNYYVSTSGSDSNAGTSTNAAYLTIQKAANVMNAGDTCYILSGTYRETVIPAKSGASG